MKLRQLIQALQAIETEQGNIECFTVEGYDGENTVSLTTEQVTVGESVKELRGHFSELAGQTGVSKGDNVLIIGD